MGHKESKYSLMLKGFSMGVADIVPGVSGGTIALITGVYTRLIESISRVNKDFVKLIINLKIKQAMGHIDAAFLFPLLAGIALAIISMSRIVHYLLEHYAVYTWSLFFGLILSSIIFLFKKIGNPKSLGTILFLCLGTAFGYMVVSLTPSYTSNTSLSLFIAGSIAICAMILPGISGSFILLILGKYMYVTGAIKNPFMAGSLETIAVFALGCLVGILSFSKLLNFLLNKYHSQTMAILTGFMLGSIKKIWPWREAIEQKVIRGKTYTLQEVNILPHSFDVEVLLAIIIMLIGFSLVFILERKGNQ